MEFRDLPPATRPSQWSAPTRAPTPVSVVGDDEQRSRSPQSDSSAIQRQPSSAAPSVISWKTALSRPATPSQSTNIPEAQNDTSLPVPTGRSQARVLSTVHELIHDNPQEQDNEAHEDLDRQRTLPGPSRAGDLEGQPLITGDIGAPEQIEPRPEATYETTSLRREFQRTHIFMITFSLVLGMGFYVRTGTIEALGGQSAVIFAYGFLGILALAIMHCLSTMLRVYPIRGPLVAFVAALVDPEVGMVVGWLYWLTFCFSFAGLTTTIGGLVGDLHLGTRTSIAVTVISLVAPILVNLTDIRIFKRVEVFFGALKLLLTFFIIVMMMFINPDVAHSHVNTPKEEKRDVVFRSAGAAGWFGAICVSVIYASIAFVGIEAVAATTMEADFGEESSGSPCNSEQQSQQQGPGMGESVPNDPFRQPAMLVPVVVTLTYLLGGWIVTENIAWDDDRLPSLQWSSKTSSIFVLSARDKSEGHAAVLTWLLITSVASTSSTALYVASRSLFGMALRLSGHLENHHDRADTTRMERFFKIVAWKNRFHVPWVSVVASAGWTSILLFLQYHSSVEFISKVIDLVIEMGSVCCILVWGCVCLAAGRLYQICHLHNNIAPQRTNRLLRIGSNSRVRLQMTLAFTTSFVCFLIVILGGAMEFAHTKRVLDGVGALSMGLLFVSGTIGLKIWRFRNGHTVSFQLPDGKTPKMAKTILSELEYQCKGNARIIRP